MNDALEAYTQCTTFVRIHTTSAEVMTERLGLICTQYYLCSAHRRKRACGAGPNSWCTDQAGQGRDHAAGWSGCTPTSSVTCLYIHPHQTTSPSAHARERTFR